MKMIQKFSVAFSGLIYCLRTQINMAIHLAAMLMVIALGWYLHLHSWEWAILAITIAAVLAAEIFNTAVEVIVDLTTTKQYHPLARIAKDVAAGAVLVTSLGAVAVGYFIFGPYFGF